MKITPENKTLAAIFETTSDNQYIIPNYQRNYSWHEEQIETLFDDINHEDQGYYIGNLLINNDDTSYNVIDGQQRLTTLSLMLLAIYENLNKFRVDMNPASSILNKIVETQMDIRRQLLVNGNVRLKLLDIDQKVWENLVKILNDDTQGGWGRYLLFKRYKYIRDELFNLENFEVAEDLILFYKKLVNVEILQIFVPDLSDAYQVFASFNSKGLPLTPLDLLKNIYLSKNGTLDNWMKLKDVFTNNDEENTSKLTSFILNNFDAFETDSAASLTKGKLVKEYEKLFNKNGPNYLSKLLERSNQFIRIASDSQNYSWDFSGLSKLDATTSYPLLLNLLCNQDDYNLSNDQINCIVKDLIRLYILRNIALTPKSSNLRSALNSIRKYIVDNGLRSNEIVEYIHNKLQSVQPKWESVKIALQDGIYDKNKKTTRFILISLEREYGKFFDKSNPDSLDLYDEKGNLRWSIEHIIPQGLHISDQWKDILSPTERDRATEIQSQNVHKIGNLTLTPYNSEMGNKSFVDKKNYTIDGKPVGLSLGLYLNETINKGKDVFAIDELNERQKILTEKIKEMFVIK